MPEWRAWVRRRLSGCGLSPAAAIDVVEELAQHVEDRYRALAAAGLAESEAVAQSLREIDDAGLVAELRDALRPGSA